MQSTQTMQKNQIKMLGGIDLLTFIVFLCYKQTPAE